MNPIDCPEKEINDFKKSLLAFIEHGRYYQKFIYEEFVIKNGEYLKNEKSKKFDIFLENIMK